MKRNGTDSKNGKALWLVCRMFYRECKVKHRQHLLTVHLTDRVVTDSAVTDSAVTDSAVTDSAAG